MYLWKCIILGVLSFLIVSHVSPVVAGGDDEDDTNSESDEEDSGECSCNFNGDDEDDEGGRMGKDQEDGTESCTCEEECEEDLDVWLGVGITFIVLSGLASIFTLALTVTTGLGCHWYWSLKKLNREQQNSNQVETEQTTDNQEDHD